MDVELTLHFSTCCMYNSGYKSPEKNKVNGSRSKKLVTLCFFLYLFIYLSSFADVVHPEDIPGLCWGWTSASGALFRAKERDMGWPSFFSEWGPLLYSSRGFYTLSYTYSKVQNAESTQHSISNNFYRYQVPSCESLIFCTSSSIPEACWYSMTSFW